MSRARFVFKQIHVRGAGTSDLARYVAKSKLDAAREGAKPRELFTDRADSLTHIEGREWLSITGGALEKRDVLHYVLSFGDAREYEALGEDEDERRRQVVAFIRRAMAKSLSEVGVAEIRWLAGIHRNTSNPHVHLLLNKNALDRAAQGLVRLPKLPAPVIAHYTTAAAGAREFSHGLLINSFADQVDARHRARVRSLQFENALRSIRIDRDLLAPEALSSRGPTEVERLVGRWIVAEIESASSTPTQVQYTRTGINQLGLGAGETLEREAPASRLEALRAEVARLDGAALAQGQTAPRAFIETEQLRALLVSPPRGLTILTEETSARFENVRKADERARQGHDARNLQHGVSGGLNTPAHDTKEQSRNSHHPIHTL
jgi:hypothetical protein